MRDKASSDTGDVSADVIGGRLYFFSHPRNRFTYYAGGEGATLAVDTPHEGISIGGMAAGGFVGLEYRLTERLSWGMDVGMYQLTLEESSLRIVESGSDFVINSFLNFHVL